MKKVAIVLFLVVAATIMVSSAPFFGAFIALRVLKFGIQFVQIGSKVNGFLTHARRIGRFAMSDSVQDIFLKASVVDVDDCAKSLICQLSTKSKESLDSLERSVFDIYNKNSIIDVTKPDVEFQLAANIGLNAGLKQCQTIYARCPLDYHQLLEAIETPRK